VIYQGLDSQNIKLEDFYAQGWSKDHNGYYNSDTQIFRKCGFVDIYGGSSSLDYTKRTKRLYW
jgi:hypothetical protein